jgi:hypothetical protein
MVGADGGRSRAANEHFATIRYTTDAEFVAAPKAISTTRTRSTPPLLAPVAAGADPRRDAAANGR